MATLHLRHINGKEALEKFMAAIAEFYDGNVIRQIIIHSNLQDGHVKLENIAARVLTSQLPIKKLAELLTERPYLYCRQMIAAFDHGEKVVYSTDEVVANLEITGPSHMPPERFGDQLIRMTDVLGRYFTLTRKPEVLNEHLSAEQKEGMRYYERALSDLTAQAAQLGRVAANQIQESQKVVDQRIAELENRYDQRLQALEADYQARKQDLDRREQDLRQQAQQQVQTLAAEYQTKKQDLDRQIQELRQQAEQQTKSLEAEFQARKQDLDRREQELEQRYEQRVQTLSADSQALRQELTRREQELESRYQQRLQALEAEIQAKQADLDRREQKLKQQAEQQVQALEADYQAASQDLERRKQELEKRYEQRVQSLETSYQARKKDLDRREQELKQEAEQQARSMEASYQARRQDQDRREQDLEKRFEQRLKTMETDFQARNQDLDRREQELKEQAEQFDSQARMLSRRELVEKMQNLLEQQKEISASPATEQKRKILHQVCLPVLAGLGGLLLFLVIWMAIRSEATWRTLVPLAVVTIGFGWTLAFYLRFNHQWFAEHARAEFANRKLRSDILRANWVIELLYESKENSKIDLPDNLLANFTQGLFDGNNGTHKELHRAEILSRGK